MYSGKRGGQQRPQRRGQNRTGPHRTATAVLRPEVILHGRHQHHRARHQSMARQRCQRGHRPEASGPPRARPASAEARFRRGPWRSSGRRPHERQQGNWYLSHIATRRVATTPRRGCRPWAALNASISVVITPLAAHSASTKAAIGAPAAARPARPRSSGSDPRRPAGRGNSSAVILRDTAAAVHLRENAVVVVRIGQRQQRRIGRSLSLSQRPVPVSRGGRAPKPRKKSKHRAYTIIPEPLWHSGMAHASAS